MLLAVAGMIVVVAPIGLAGQEVGGDVMIPPPRELVGSAMARGPEAGSTGPATPAEFRAVIETVMAGVREGTVTESEARKRLGNVIVSLLIKRNALVFDGGGG